MEHLEVKSKVKDYIQNYFHVDSLDDSSNIFESGGINSLFFIQLLVFIEKTFSVQLEIDEFDFRTLTSINKISEFISNKLLG